MATFDTPENQRIDLTRRTIDSLLNTVDFSKHRLFVIDNHPTPEGRAIIRNAQEKIGGTRIGYIKNKENLGTAEAINKGWYWRSPNENCIKIDNDVVIYQTGWVEELEEAIKRDPKIGIIGLKRKDCWETPDHKDSFYKSELIMLPHNPPQRWMVVERVNHVMGTCQMYSAALLSKIGFLWQPALYGFDDSFAAVRSHLAGFYNCFLPHIDMDHIDPGTTPYQKWKEEHAAQCWTAYHEALRDYKSGAKSIYYKPNG